MLKCSLSEDDSLCYHFSHDCAMSATSLPIHRPFPSGYSYILFILKFLPSHKVTFPSTSFFLFVWKVLEDTGLKQRSLGTHCPHSSHLIIHLLNGFCFWKSTFANVSYALPLHPSNAWHIFYIILGLLFDLS